MKKLSLAEKELLLKDLSARLAHGVKGRVYAEVSDGQYDIMGDLIFYNAPFVVTLDEINTSTEEIHVIAVGNEDTVDFIDEAQKDGEPYVIDDFKPYLRRLSSMTEDEKEELLSLVGEETKIVIEQIKTNNCGIEEGKYHFNHLLELDWLNKKMFAYRTIDGKDMFELGLALEAPDGMYK